LNIFDGNLYFLLSILFSLVEDIFKPGAYISDFAFFVSYANERSLSDFKFPNVSDKKKFLTHGADSSLKLEQDWYDVSVLIFSKQESFVRVDLFVLVFVKLQEVMVMLLGIDFGHN
jgi:hypothetical protein